jgi:hypothetical protein
MLDAFSIRTQETVLPLISETTFARSTVQGTSLITCTNTLMGQPQRHRTVSDNTVI